MQSSSRTRVGKPWLTLHSRARRKQRACSSGNAADQRQRFPASRSRGGKKPKKKAFLILLGKMDRCAERTRAGYADLRRGHNEPAARRRGAPGEAPARLRRRLAAAAATCRVRRQTPGPRPRPRPFSGGAAAGSGKGSAGPRWAPARPLARPSREAAAPAAPPGAAPPALPEGGPGRCEGAERRGRPRAPQPVPAPAPPRLLPGPGAPEGGWGGGGDAPGPAATTHPHPTPTPRQPRGPQARQRRARARTHTRAHPSRLAPKMAPLRTTALRAHKPRERSPGRGCPAPPRPAGGSPRAVTSRGRPEARSARGTEGIPGARATPAGVPGTAVTNRAAA